MRGFQPLLWSKVKQRLEIKFPDFDQDSAYMLEQVYNAATYILHGTHPSLLPQHPITQIKPPEQPASHGKLEDLKALIGQITQAMQTLVTVQMQNASANMSATSATIIPPIHNHQNHNPAGTTCNFCGKVGHFLGSCPMVVIYIAAGKFSRNQDGKLVLPSGAFIPHIIVGRNLAEQFDEWHQQNPGQLATTQPSSNTNTTAHISNATQMLYDCVPSKELDAIASNQVQGL
jgi:hypothetical protein